MREQFSNDPDDVQWARDVHLWGLDFLRFASFVIVGNEDSPDELRLYASDDPLHTDPYVRVTFDGPEGARRVMLADFDFEAFVRAYAECALWSTCGPEDGPHACENLDDLFSIEDIAPETMASMREDCTDFIASNAFDLIAYCARMKNEQWSGEARAGHDFWLTRNGHGAGFWDRGLGDLGERLTDTARVYRGVDLYPGDDGRVYGG